MERIALGATLPFFAPVSILRRIGARLETAYVLRRVIARDILRPVLGRRAHTGRVRAFQQVASE